MTLDDLLRDSLERSADTQRAPSGLDARALRSGRRLQHRRRSALATASAGMLAAAAVGAYTALPELGAAPTAATGQDSTQADPLTGVLTQMAALPDPGASAPFWYTREASHIVHDGAVTDDTAQEWLGRTEPGRRLHADGSVQAMDRAGFPSLGSGDLNSQEPIDWDQLDALPTAPDQLAAAVAKQASTVAANPVRDEPSPAPEQATLGALANLLYIPPSSPALRAAAIGLLAKTPGAQVRTGGTDSTGRTGISITYQEPGEIENIIVDERSGQVLEQSATATDGTQTRVTWLASAPVESISSVPPAG